MSDEMLGRASHQAIDCLKAMIESTASTAADAAAMAEALESGRAAIEAYEAAVSRSATRDRGDEVSTLLENEALESTEIVRGVTAVAASAALVFDVLPLPLLPSELIVVTERRRWVVTQMERMGRRARVVAALGLPAGSRADDTTPPRASAVMVLLAEDGGLYLQERVVDVALDGGGDTVPWFGSSRATRARLAFEQEPLSAPVAWPKSPVDPIDVARCVDLARLLADAVKLAHDCLATEAAQILETRKRLGLSW